MMGTICQIHPIVKSLHFHNKQKLVGIPGQYSYRISSTGGGSDKYGDCEVCHQHCAEVFIQTQVRYYEHSLSRADLPRGGWTLHNCRTLFGHEACLRSQRPLIERKA